MPPDTAASPDLTLKQVRSTYNLSLSTQYKLIKAGELESFMFAGQRVVTVRSILAYRERCRALGPRLGPPVPGPRPRGRPRKLKPEQSASAAAE